MGWFKVDDTYYEHFKVLEAGATAADLNLRGMAYCSRNQTDGKIPFVAVDLLAPGRDVTEDIEALVEAGLWKKRTKFYEIHDYLEHQSSRAQIRAKREGSKKRMQKSRDRSRDVAPQQERNNDATLRDGCTDVRAPETDTELDTDVEADADLVTPGLEDSSIKASALQALETQSPDGFDEIVASIGNGGVDDSRAVA